MVEPWLRGTLTEVDAVRRQVLHALELTGEDAERWCASLSREEMHERPSGLPSVAFHLRHIARSLDRLLTYAEDLSLTDLQHAALNSEMNGEGTTPEVMAELHAGLADASRRILQILPSDFSFPRSVGRAKLPTTVGGLLVHCAEHTQRHIGQAITTAKIVTAQRINTP